VELEDFGGSLRDKVKAQIQPAIEECLKYRNQSHQIQSTNHKLAHVESSKAPVCRHPLVQHLHQTHIAG
jgi:hypothetical protein